MEEGYHHVTYPLDVTSLVKTFQEMSRYSNGRYESAAKEFNDMPPSSSRS